MTLTLIQAFIFISYVTFLLIRFKGPLPSISESWYALGFPTNILFTVFCWALAITMCFHTTDGWGGLYFLSGAGFGLVGAATMFKIPDVRPYHFGGAMTGIIVALLGIWLVNGDILPFIIWAITSILLLGFNIKNKMWWVEIAAFVAIILGFLLS
jgi:hypothetical protein